MECIVPRCTNQIPKQRFNYGGVTCSKECGKINYQNMQTLRRAEKAGKVVALCGSCNKTFVVHDGPKVDNCLKCRFPKEAKLAVGRLVTSLGRLYSVAEILGFSGAKPTGKELISASPVTDTGYIMTRTRHFLSDNWEVAPCPQ